MHVAETGSRWSHARSRRQAPPTSGGRTRAWYDSPAYRAILPLRTRDIDGDLIVFAGVGADHDAARLTDHVDTWTGVGLTPGENVVEVTGSRAGTTYTDTVRWTLR